MSIDYYAQVIQDLHANWTPHPGQIEVGKVILNKVVQQIFLECGRNWGKALALDTPVATPAGFRAIGDIRTGDLVLGSNGLPCRVVKAHEVLFDRRCFQIEFLNGEKITACEDHLWEVSTKSDRKHKKKPRVIKTKDMVGKTSLGYEYNFHIRSHVIKSIKDVPSVPVRCLTVDAEDSLFLVSKSFIPTHNTEFMCYMFWRTALLNPGSENYYFAPLQNQGREIIWIPGRIKTFGPQDYIEGINDTEMRITFKNGSFIKVDGSDNIDKYRGIKIVNGGLVGFDEYKDFRPDFYGVFDPNILDGSLIIVGTPPEAESHFTKDADEFATNPKKRHFNMPSETNPHLSREWLANKKAELYAKGDGVIWEREYMAKRVKGGKASILPQAHSVELKSQREMLRSIARDSKRLQWFCIADPGTATCFAVMFLALNSNTKRIHVFETIYERDPTQTGVTQIGPRIIETKNRLAPNSEWTYVCDEAALWFIKEMFDNHSISFNQTTKSTNDKEGQLGMMKDIMLMGMLEIAGRPGMEKDLKSDDLLFAEAFLWEMQNYIKDKHGKIPKTNDHLIDDFRYFLSEALYELPGKAEAQKASKDDRRGYTMDEEFKDQMDGDLEVY